MDLEEERCNNQPAVAKKPLYVLMGQNRNEEMCFEKWLTQETQALSNSTLFKN